MERDGMKLSLNKVRVKRHSLTLVADATFSEGLHIIRGPVGSGKSSLALAMAGQLALTEGSIERQGIGSCTLSLQFPEYHITGLTLAEECASWDLDPCLILPSSGLQGMDDRNPLSLSRGELKRLHLACVLEKSYDLLLLDEPFSALDCDQKEILCNRLSVRTFGITIVFTHEQQILPNSGQFWEIRDGKLLDLRTSLLKMPDSRFGSHVQKMRNEG